MMKDQRTSPTVIVDQYRRNSDASPNANQYKGLQIHALPGLHPFLMEALLASDAAAPGRVLDLAAGTGAMSLRLRDAGYSVTATDYVTENFKLHSDFEFFQADLNEDFPDAFRDAFDVVMASEIIEHLENPRHFARQCARVLRAGGLVILSSPNIDSTESIILNLQLGNHHWFNEFNYRVDGHITPMGQWYTRKCFAEAGFSVQWESSFGDASHSLAGSPRLRFLARLLAKMRRLPVTLRGEIYCAVFRKL